jgi:hypothetical protein
MDIVIKVETAVLSPSRGPSRATSALVAPEYAEWPLVMVQASGGEPLVDLDIYFCADGYELLYVGTLVSGGALTVPLPRKPSRVMVRPVEEGIHWQGTITLTPLTWEDRGGGIDQILGTSHIIPCLV